MADVPAQISDEKSSCSYLVPLCYNTSHWSCKDMHKLVCREKVHITFLNIACKNMWWGGIDTNVKTVMKYSFQMYIIACRAHFCHLLGLGQVGHSPRGTSGSAGTLDWGPMWSGSQSTCHPNTPLTPPIPLIPPKWPPTSTRSPNAPDAPIPLLAPKYLESLSAPQYTPDTPYTPDAPDTPKMAPTSLGAPNAPWCPHTPSGPWVPRVPLSPQYTQHPYTLMPLTPQNSPYIPLEPPNAPDAPIPLLALITYSLCQPPNAPLSPP